MIWKTPECPYCDRALHNLGVDFVNARVICANCQQEIDPAFLIDSYNVNYIAELIPEEYKESFLKEIGFEKKAGNVIPKGILRFLVTFLVIAMILVTIIGIIIRGSILDIFWAVLLNGGMIMVFISYYKEATKLKWRKIKKK